jgi:hypothetical protein
MRRTRNVGRSGGGSRLRLHEDRPIPKSPFKSFNSVPRQLLQSVYARTLNLAPVLVSPFSQLGILADYAAWKRLRLERNGKPFFPYREKLWEAILPRLASKGPLIAMEFGVAWGYAANWWLSRLHDPALEWHGFDTFTGLPTTWDRGGLTMYEAGAFTAGGQTPPIGDPRAQWHVGLIGDTIAGVDWEAFASRPLFLFLDFDLYEPTMIALEAAAPHLKPGDVLYFDEAHDAWNERRAIDEVLVPRFGLTCLGSTSTALALEIAERTGT